MNPLSRNFRPLRFFIAFAIVWLIAFAAISHHFADVLHYSKFLLLGVVGAIFANSTGAGGGVVFIPFFNQLGVTEAQSVATSFAIQCFGMTAGAVAWSRYFLHAVQPEPYQSLMKRLLLVTCLPSILGIWFAYILGLQAPGSLHYSFAWFSVFLGSALLLSLLRKSSVRERNHVDTPEKLLLTVISFIGGVITAWLSVGVGELIALYLIFRGFNVGFSVAIAVIVSAFSVWSAIPYHALVEPNVYWQILIFAGPGALVGGVVARRLAMAMSPLILKIFCSGWVLLMGVVILV